MGKVTVSLSALESQIVRIVNAVADSNVFTVHQMLPAEYKNKSTLGEIANMLAKLETQALLDSQSSESVLHNGRPTRVYITTESGKYHAENYLN